MKNKVYNIILALLCLCRPSLVLSAQSERVDTLDASYVEGIRELAIRNVGELRSDIKEVRGVVSPLGEGDPIRWIQGLPGVTTGADGTSAVYVRGGNMSNTLFSIDGVPVYGYSHLLGLTTIVPQGIMDDVSIVKGGFDGKESNFTAAHLRLTSKSPGESEKRFSASINNFIVSASADMKLNKRLSFIASARVSPLTYEYRAVHSALPDKLGGYDDFKAGVWDAYGKLQWRYGKASRDNRLEASVLGSMDHYSFSKKENSSEAMGWDNVLAILKNRMTGPRSRTEFLLTYNHYRTYQRQDKLFRDKMNHLSIESVVDEYTLSVDRSREFGKRVTIDYGLKGRMGKFAPGQKGSSKKEETTVLGSVYLQGSYAIPKKLLLKANVRENLFNNGGSSNKLDFNFSAKWDMFPFLAVDASYDNMNQFYHVLEGLPVGWSVDMMVPSGKSVLPETSRQWSAGIESKVARNYLSVTAFGKEMKDIVYYKYSQAMFTGALASWENDIDIGDGSSKGLEFLYEYNGKEFYARASYTLSKTDRKNFEVANWGKPYHARFDRRHVLNVTAKWKGLSAAFTLQSGQWENASPDTYVLQNMSGDDVTMKYFYGINNYQMPKIVRLDLGYEFSITRGKVRHDVNLGVCNVFNHFNPFMLYFDAERETWRKLALLPILPNFSYKISF